MNAHGFTECTEIPDFNVQGPDGLRGDVKVRILRSQALSLLVAAVVEDSPAHADAADIVLTAFTAAQAHEICVHLQDAITRVYGANDMTLHLVPAKEDSPHVTLEPLDQPIDLTLNATSACRASFNGVNPASI